ncbi:MAG: sigma-70 family RNA polymerase sigma factor [Phycisphaerae bacterium]|nr:sigma-70 family RNA polymerase sigma factor [Phycisphaerae bacterium]
MSDVTRILNAMEQGDARAADQLLPMVYDELRRLAAYQLSRERPGQTLQATALVHEAYLRLVGAGSPDWQGHTHFFNAAAEAMRRILIDSARHRQRLRRGGAHRRVNLEDMDLAVEAQSEELIALDDALTRLAEQDNAKAKLVQLHYFAGLTLEQAAEVMGISVSTAKRHWTYAKAWLYGQIRVRD